MTERKISQSFTDACESRKMNTHTRYKKRFFIRPSTNQLITLMIFERRRKLETQPCWIYPNAQVIELLGAANVWVDGFEKQKKKKSQPLDTFLVSFSLFWTKRFTHNGENFSPEVSYSNGNHRLSAFPLQNCSPFRCIDVEKFIIACFTSGKARRRKSKRCWNESFMNEFWTQGESAGQKSVTSTSTWTLATPVFKALEQKEVGEKSILLTWKKSTPKAGGSCVCREINSFEGLFSHFSATQEVVYL